MSDTSRTTPPDLSVEPGVSVEHDPAPATAPAHRPDVVRQVVVAVSAVVAVVGSAIGSGAFGGTPIAEAGGGALSAEATLVAPDGPAFAIWSLIYLGLVAYAVWQALPAQRTDPRQRRTGWLAAASLVLNAVWILVAQAGYVAASAVIIVGLLVVLVAILARLVRSVPASRTEGVLVDGTFGLYAGWVSAATIANIAAALVDAGVTQGVLGADTWGVFVTAVAAGVGTYVASVTRGSFGYGGALAWGLVWIAIGRTSGPDSSATVVVAAGLAAAIVVAATLIARAGRLRS
ncbi:tryptophan-rich sensory protein [Kineosporia sp. A_224]|uniref:tryptophan-rich sensory protein n=1 Tax=Kineosporia sp. A_224 TaxID=1962180 RepID=UPI000B4B3040|nr:tryptophan-rich sensory protein [Kineosporia sp. A_224]